MFLDASATCASKYGDLSAHRKGSSSRSVATTPSDGFEAHRVLALGPKSTVGHGRQAVIDSKRGRAGAILAFSRKQD